jgi:hypothetical protein
MRVFNTAKQHRFSIHSFQFEIKIYEETPTNSQANLKKLQLTYIYIIINRILRYKLKFKYKLSKNLRSPLNWRYI